MLATSSTNNTDLKQEILRDQELIGWLRSVQENASAIPDRRLSDVLVAAIGGALYGLQCATKKKKHDLKRQYSDQDAMR